MVDSVSEKQQETKTNNKTKQKPEIGYWLATLKIHNYNSFYLIIVSPVLGIC